MFFTQLTGFFMSLIRQKAHIYLRLMRADRPIGTLLLLWPTLWALVIAAQGMPQWHLIILFSLGTFLMRSAGCVINDIADRNFDGKVERTLNRPFAKREVSIKEALILCLFLCLISMLCLLPMNRLTWLLSLPALFVALSYPFTKRFFPLPQAYLGIAFSFGIPMAFAAQSNNLPISAWILFTANLCWTVAYDTIYAIADKPDDIHLGIHSSAITFGNYDAQWAMIFHAAFSILMGVVGWQIQATWVYWLGWIVVLGLQIRQYPAIKGRDRQICFRIFLENNRIGWVWLVAILATFLINQSPNT